MVPGFLRLVREALGGALAAGPGQAAEKAGTLRAMFDGSYFYRLMEHGGDFAHMYGDSPAASPPVWEPFGLVFALAFALLGAVALRGRRRHAPQRLAELLLLATVLVLLATWLLPGAIRLHHWTLVYPLPHLVILAAAVWLWRLPAAAPAAPRGLRPLAVLAVAAVLCGHLLAIGKTERLLADTGGRGLWSDSLNAFAAAVRTRRDLTIVCYDWGFYEPLAFLTDGPRLAEPIWSLLAGHRSAIPTAPDVIHLAHPPQYRVLPFSAELFQRVNGADPGKVEITQYTDRQGGPAFYAIRFRG